MSEIRALPEMPEHGLPTLESTKRVAAAAVRDVVDPGFAAVDVNHPRLD